MTAWSSVTVRARTHPGPAHSGRPCGPSLAMGCVNTIRRGGPADISNTREEHQ